MTMFLFFFNNLIILVPMLLSVAFITLLERKFIGLSQLRKGPQKVSLGGLFQPFSDAMKLLTKEWVLMINSNKKFYSLAPMLNLTLVLTLWMMVFSSMSFSSQWMLLIFMFILGNGIYCLFFMGWSSNNKYSILGSMRGIAQSISYEISLALMIFIKMMANWSFLLSVSKSNHSGFLMISIFLSVLWLLVCIAETNRSPFDFSEGESELVSGFNTEYSGGSFTLIFLSEYSMIMFLSCFSVTMILSLSFFTSLSILFAFLFVIVWLWVRTTLPRFRYDKLMDLAWKVILPGVLLYLNFFFLTKMLL